MTRIAFPRSLASAAKAAEMIVNVAPKALVASGWLGLTSPPELVAELEPAAKRCAARVDAETVATLVGGKTIHAVVLPELVSRHNAPARAEAMAAALGKLGLGGKKSVVVVGLADDAHLLPCANAIARCLPLFTRKGGKKQTEGQASILFLRADGTPVEVTREVKETVAAARWAACAVDTHPAEMTTAIFAREVKKLVRGLKHLHTTEITGAKLLEQKLGGIHAVGRCAVVPPRLLVLDYRPPKARRCFGLVGKGVIYDTGGLSLKAGANMGTMKSDMGGAAAVAGAFRALAACAFEHRVICALPMAENAIGPDAFRNDDILTMHSGKTVEINNTDAEGRLLLADGLSYVCRKYRPEAVIDAATLTGAQLVATGHRHAAVISNREGFECLAVDVGLASGDLCHPLPFAPEFYQAEFKSNVADMRNSVADRSNAQTSCAAQFVWAHIEDLDPAWLHVDLAGPAFRDGRGTGYGVALISEILRSFD
ncbi:MAG: leucyl aminopeptidase family protein [Planctomycetes bacterium]|nr:leucyl aminopeptidase family protein [Planctomycetota bacterium]